MVLAGDDHVASDGRVMEMLGEHQCEGWLEGYLGTFSLWQSTGQLRFGHSVEKRIAIIRSLFVVFDDLSQSP
jgi:xylulose-5-phosphate/fructose-6-phosphate phosphoketolase